MKISVILPFYNNESTILKSLRSILNQSEKNFEIIIINDGSKDKSEKKILNIIKKKNIKYLKNRINKGLAYSLNKGIKKSNGDLIFRMDADDISKKNRIKIQKNFLVKNPNISLLGTNAEYFDKRGIYEKSSLKLTDKEIKKVINFKNEFIHSSVVFRRTFFNKLNGYDVFLRRGQDHDLWIRGSSYFKYANLSQSLVKHYRDKKPKSIKTYLYMAYVVFKNFKDKGKIFSGIYYIFFFVLQYIYHNLKFSFFKKQ